MILLQVSRLLFQTFISIILIKLIYCLMVPKAIRVSLSKIGVTLTELTCIGLNGVVNNFVPKQSKSDKKAILKSDKKANLRIVK